MRMMRYIGNTSKLPKFGKKFGKIEEVKYSAEVGILRRSDLRRFRKFDKFDKIEETKMQIKMV